jgi:hypothetical protein
MSNNITEGVQQDEYHRSLFIYIAIVVVILSSLLLLRRFKQQNIHMQVIKEEENKQKIAREQVYVHKFNNDLSI